MTAFEIAWPKNKASKVPAGRSWPATGTAPLSVTQVEGVCTAKGAKPIEGKPLPLIYSKDKKSKHWVIIFSGLKAGETYDLTVTPYDDKGVLPSKTVTIVPQQLQQLALLAVPVVEHPAPHTDPWDDLMAWGESDEPLSLCNVTRTDITPNQDFDNDGLTWDSGIWCGFFDTLTTGSYTLHVANSAGSVDVPDLQVP